MQGIRHYSSVMNSAHILLSFSNTITSSAAVRQTNKISSCKTGMCINQIISQRGNSGEKHKFTNELPFILPSLGAIRARLQRPSRIYV